VWAYRLQVLSPLLQNKLLERRTREASSVWRGHLKFVFKSFHVLFIVKLGLNWQNARSVSLGLVVCLCGDSCWRWWTWAFKRRYRVQWCFLVDVGQMGSYVTGLRTKFAHIGTGCLNVLKPHYLDGLFTLLQLLLVYGKFDSVLLQTELFFFKTLF